MDWHTLLFLLVAALGAFVQGASGFAFALIASALWAWLIEPQVLAPTVMLTSLLGQVSSLVRVADKVRVARAGPFLIGGTVGTPVGVMLLPLFDAASFRLAIGVVLVAYCLLSLRRGALPLVTRGGRLADAGVGAISGVPHLPKVGAGGTAYPARMRIRFTKMHGLGNDFVVLDAINQAFVPTPAQAALAGRPPFRRRLRPDAAGRAGAGHAGRRFPLSHLQCRRRRGRAVRQWRALLRALRP
jgi:hypothetical protein